MKCASIRNRILSLEVPARPPTELAAHITGCEACTAWHRNLIRVETAIPLLAIPPSNAEAKKNFLQSVRSGKLPSNRSTAKNRRAPTALTDRPTPRTDKVSWSERVLAYWPAGLIAATLLIGTMAWLSLRGSRPSPAVSSPADPMLDVVVNANLDLAKARTPEKRIEALKKLADELHREMQDICRVDPTGENMNELQQMYRDVVFRGILVQAQPRLLIGTDTEKKIELEKLAKWLAEAGQQAEQLASEVPQGSVRPLQEVAEVARQGTKRIREELMRGTS